MKATLTFLVLVSALEIQLLGQSCSPVSMRLDSRAGYGFKKKVGFGSYDPNDAYRMFLNSTWSQTVNVTGYSNPNVPQTGSLDAVYSHAAHYDRQDDNGGPIFHDSTVNISAAVSYPGVSDSANFNGVITDPKSSAQVHAEVLGSDRVMDWNGQSILGAQKLFLLDWNVGSDSESTAPEVRSVTELWFDRRTMTLTGDESGTRYGPDFHGHLASEYTTEMVIADARRRATDALASTWDPVVNPSTATLSSSLTLAAHELSAGADLTVWRATLDHGEYGKRYEVRWLEWFVPQGGTAGKPTLRRKKFEGTGAGSSVEVEVPLPSQPGVTVARVLGAFPANRSNDDPGNGAPQDMVGGCCGGGGGGSGPVGKVPEAQFSVSLGNDRNGNNMGELDFSTAETGSDTTALRNIRWNGTRQAGGSVQEYARPDQRCPWRVRGRLPKKSVEGPEQPAIAFEEQFHFEWSG